MEDAGFDAVLLSQGGLETLSLQVRGGGRRCGSACQLVTMG